MSKKTINCYNDLSVEKRIFLHEFDRIHEALRLSNDEILDLIQKHYPDVKLGTYNDTINRKLQNLNPYVVMAFCKTFGIDLYTIYKDKSKDDDSITNYNTIAGAKSSFPDGFYGKFYGYFFNNDSAYISSGLIDQFVLNVTKNEISLEVRHYSVSKELNKIKDPDVIVLDGTIIFNDSSPYGTVAISFGSLENNWFVTLAYNKFPVKNTLHFRRGVMLTENHGTPAVHHPVIQSFIFTNKKIDLNDTVKKQVIQGALCLSSDCLSVKKDALKKYKDSELLQLYQEETAFIDFNDTERTMVRLREDILQSIIIKNDVKLYQTFFQIKALSRNRKILEFPDFESSWYYIASLGEENKR